ncbi:uncharacterized protein ASCRUDRAFT_80195 [Ascoidea rubescens DSM 1968]|uniref:Uncharacterized protein n=1 Tax=Ascoidea rubescens DSM 1968 TaxID=1344418 RepID=A0A1D2VJP5_9ASCO|nr:hypothetical protein ASCRUDRAFT_80195 [Ascoidea rubescens DSM 1968]ODV61803.1 hypothetical protein ASCRUDRAFT_80195 [Ascoidea rubescens DSM 1968]
MFPRCSTIVLCTSSSCWPLLSSSSIFLRPVPGFVLLLRLQPSEEAAPPVAFASSGDRAVSAPECFSESSAVSVQQTKN